MSESPARLLARLQRASPFVARTLVGATALGLVRTVATIVQAVALAGAVTTLFATPSRSVAGYVTWLLAATAARALAAGGAEPLAATLAAPVRRDLRRRALHQVLRRGRPTTLDATVQLVTRGVDAVESYLATTVPSLALAALAPPVVIGYLVARDWLSGLIVAGSAALRPLFMPLLGRAAKEAMESRWRDQQRLAAYFGDVVRGMTVLKSFNRSHDAVERLDEVGAALERSTITTLRVAFLSSFALELLSSLATALVALVLGLRLVDGRVSLDVALTVLILTPEAFLPLRRAAAQYHASANGVAAAGEVLDLLERATPRGTGPAPTRPPRLEFADVVARPGLAPVRATIEPGSLATVTGPSGIGKSSLAAVLAGLRDPEAGHVLVDGVDLASVDVAAWQDRVGWVGQEPTLRGRTVRDAVRLDRDVDDDAVRAALSRLDLDLDLDRTVGETGTLSAGERRRVALAACLLDEPLVLILDEPTAHLDAASEAAVRAAVASSPATRVVLSHREWRGDHRIEITS